MYDECKYCVKTNSNVSEPEHAWEQENVVLYCTWSYNNGHLTQKIALWNQMKASGLIIKGGHKIEGTK